jgi:predicted DNA-binding ribbon-helix-helix protein
MGPGRPKKDPAKRRDARIQLYLTKTKKQWIKNCAKGQKISMSRYIEKILDGQAEEMNLADFTSFLLEMRESLQNIRDEIQHDTSKDIVLGYVESAIDRINIKGREINTVKSGPPSPEGSSEKGSSEVRNGQ